jgi:hypothetical protein
MEEMDNKKSNCEEDNEIKFAKELDHEAFNVILRLYNKTFKALVDK